MKPSQNRSRLTDRHKDACTSFMPRDKESAHTVTQWFKPLHPPRGSSIAEAINNNRRLLGGVADSLIHVTTFISV